MRKGIPEVRKWRVQYLNKGVVVGSCTVDTITRRFAKWMAIDKIGYPILKGADKVTCSLIRYTDKGIRKAAPVRIGGATIAVYNKGRIKSEL